MHRRALLSLAILLTAAPVFGAEPQVPLLPGLGDFTRKVTTSSPLAQQYFDQGMVLGWGFDFESARRAMEEATRQDPESPMTWWGLALVWGPHINLPTMDPEQSAAAWAALQKAAALADRGTDVERALIGALQSRYADPAPEDRTALDRAYADAMREVWKRFPKDADVGALFAEALMDTRPWDLWSNEGEPRPETPEVLATLERVLEMSPMHPAANHLYIHSVEASPDPGRAVACAERLESLVPGMGHLVHMPSHVWIRLGRYDEAVRDNQRAITADFAHVEKVGRDPIETIYRAHNFHFLAYAAMFDGRRDVATTAAEGMLEELPLELVRAIPDFLDAFMAVPYHVMVRFGQWDELIAEPAPPEDLVVTVAFYHYARALAFAALGRVEEAQAERQLLETAYQNMPESRLIGNNTARVVLELARPMTDGEIEYRRGNYDVAFERLREAVRHDDELRYDEPWGWMQPVRHALGALLLEQGRLDEAEQVYRRDLELHPGNGWALHGLAECLQRAGRKAEAAEMQAAFKKAWSHSDTPIQASCFCRRGT